MWVIPNLIMGIPGDGYNGTLRWVEEYLDVIPAVNVNWLSRFTTATSVETFASLAQVEDRALRTDTRLTALARQVVERTDDPRLEVRAWRSGVDFWADLAVVGDDVIGVVRSPREEIVATSYEGVVDFGAVIEKEVVVLDLLVGCGIPAPRVQDCRRGSQAGDPSWMLCDYLPHEPTLELDEAVQRELAAIAGAIHQITTDAPQLRREESWVDYILRRLKTRLRAARSDCVFPPVGEILEAAQVRPH